ncbi:MAG: hypothetical protein H7096_06240 [Flavobacterium sp.]|nr:hypothetical protein [Pedobacter sp.]
MKSFRFFTTALFVFLQTLAHAQPHIQGNIAIKMKDGLIDCDFTLSNLPRLSQYKILLNHGMNLQYFTTDSGKVIRYEGFYSGKTRGEAIEYFFINNNNDTLKKMPESFGVKYRGAFPVYGEKLSFLDWKGKIVFNGQTLRATEQSKWYPVIYDVVNDRIIDTYTYKITVTTDDSKTVFINGSLPQQTRVATFTSAVPRQLLLFAGNYDYVNVGGNYILNAGLDTSTANQIFKELDKIKVFYQDKLGLSYKENIYLISHKAVEPYGPQRSWGFAIFPSFAYAGLDFKTLINAKRKFDFDNTAFFGHELAHYYFGSNVGSGILQWFWLESTAEYLALKVAQEFTNETFYNEKVKDYANRIKNKKYKPLSQIKNVEEIDNDYRYSYGPLILLAFEKQFGEKQTYKVLSDVVKRSEKETISLRVLREIALANKIKTADFDAFYSTYLASDEALDHTIQRITIDKN